MSLYDKMLMYDQVNSSGSLHCSAVSAEKGNSQRGINMVIIDGE